MFLLRKVHTFLCLFVRLTATSRTDTDVSYSVYLWVTFSVLETRSLLWRKYVSTTSKRQNESKCSEASNKSFISIHNILGLHWTWHVPIVSEMYWLGWKHKGCQIILGHAVSIVFVMIDGYKQHITGGHSRNMAPTICAFILTKWLTGDIPMLKLVKCRFNKKTSQNS